MTSVFGENVKITWVLSQWINSLHVAWFSLPYKDGMAG
jgi:hypothetical protein